ncbi:unnamed protein product [Cyclocybe aegerita]|uniref:Uncharacterized protein n=1 Tax=Cyclocybe aegerita TaxID=1973307 RepID=A0A8S0WPS9_CYCAE|nr:unnamed protein product [Cyclocybe aegerita]
MSSSRHPPGPRSLAPPPASHCNPPPNAHLRPSRPSLPPAYALPEPVSRPLHEPPSGTPHATFPTAPLHCNRNRPQVQAALSCVLTIANPDPTPNPTSTPLVGYVATKTKQDEPRTKGWLTRNRNHNPTLSFEFEFEGVGRAPGEARVHNLVSDDNAPLENADRPHGACAPRCR